MEGVTWVDVKGNMMEVKGNSEGIRRWRAATWVDTRIQGSRFGHGMVTGGSEDRGRDVGGYTL
eukprot:6590373-Pyramimonas_sp.AAC.1